MSAILAKLAKLVTDNIPAARSNLGKLCAEYALVHKLHGYLDERKSALNEQIKGAFTPKQDMGKEEIYRNDVFVVEAQHRKSSARFDKTKAIVALAKLHDWSADEATAWLDKNCYVGEAGKTTLALLVTHKE